MLKMNGCALSHDQYVTLKFTLSGRTVLTVVTPSKYLQLKQQLELTGLRARQWIMMAMVSSCQQWVMRLTVRLPMA